MGALNGGRRAKTEREPNAIHLESPRLINQTQDDLTAETVL